MPVPVNQPVVVRAVERICNRELRGVFFNFAKGLGAEDEGFGEIMVATGISHLDGFESLTNSNKKCRYPNGYLHFLAEDEGFEPPQTESESGVLPLHKSSMRGTFIL